MRTRNFSVGLLTAAGLATLLSCSAGPPPRDIAEARLALQDAKNAGADQRATRDYDAAWAHLSVAQSTWDKQKDAVASAHWARLAQAEARKAQYVAEAAAAQEMVSRETERRQRAELAVREAEIAMLQARARTEARGARRRSRSAPPRSAAVPRRSWRAATPRRGSGSACVPRERRASRPNARRPSRSPRPARRPSGTASPRSSRR